MDSNFTLIAESGRARAGQWSLPRGDVLTPAFMPVGTTGSVKGLIPDEFRPLSSGVILANTYHLVVRPGTQTIQRLGGLHRWMGWNGNILTDSGGFQVMSLASLCETSEDGVVFRSHYDGKAHMFTPENVVDFQIQLGSDVMMVLDECTPFGVGLERTTESMNRSMRWAKRAKSHWENIRNESNQNLFGIVQGGMIADARRESAQYLTDIGFNGYAVGGLSVGELKEQMHEMTRVSTDALPKHAVRYLMGVGKTEDLVEGVENGVDVFDCVLPTRNARNGSFFRVGRPGHENIRNARFQLQEGPLDDACECRACRQFSASFLHYQFKLGEMTALRLLTEHNLWVIRRLMHDIRESILQGKWKLFLTRFRGLESEMSRVDTPLLNLGSKTILH